MTDEIRKRIELVKNGEVPEGYQINERIGIAPITWECGILSDVLKSDQRPVPKPNKAYWRLGLRSHAKGTFYELVENPEAVAMDELFEVKENDLIVNITFAWEHAIALANKNDEGKLVSHRFPTYVFKGSNCAKYYERIVIQKRFKEMLGNISPGGAGRNRVLSKPNFLKLPCYIPPVDEQEKIANILNHCDMVIKLKKQLIAEEYKQKSWLIEKLLNPESGVRLPGFEGNWSKKVLSFLGHFSKGTGISNGDCASGEMPCIKYGDIYMNYDVQFTKTVSFATETAVKASPKIQSGTLLFAGSGEDRMEIGKCTAYMGTIPIAVGGDIIIMKVDCKKANPIFLSYQQNSDNLVKQKARLAQGYSIVHLYADHIKGLQVFIPPTIEEQTAIANILSIEDRKIELLEQELDQWQQKKKALMQLLLTGIVRV